MKSKLSEKKWFPGAVAACIGVFFYVLLTNLKPVLSVIGTVAGYFKPVFLGIVFAYILSPLARTINSRLLRKMKAGQTRWTIAVILTIVVALLVLVILGGMLIPQLVQSIALFAENIDGYADTLIRLIEKSPLESFLDTEQLRTLSGNALSTISGFVKNNAGKILSSAADSGKGILTTVMALIISVYLLFDKNRVLKGFWRLMRAILRPQATENMIDFVLRCDTILVSYLVQTLLESIIVGVINAVFMLICRMQYVGLISVVVAATNLVPNFGPIIGMAVGAFVLLMVNPLHALIFLLFSFVLQFFDGYILKPKLFSDSLGVSGLLILIASIVLGDMFGIVGMLLSVPLAAIISFIYKDYFLPSREERMKAANNRI